MSGSPIRSINAVTFAVHDMKRATAFYNSLGFELKFGGPTSDFTSYYCGDGHLNLILCPPEKHWQWWGRVIFYVDDVDTMYKQAVGLGFDVEAKPRDAEWGERYFHVNDPDGHELSFAKLL